MQVLTNHRKGTNAMNNPITTKTTPHIIICRMGWHGNKTHALYTNNAGEPDHKTVCQQNNYHAWKTPVAIKKVEATKQNVTCENCLTHIN